jgi:hypothetical protein
MACWLTSVAGGIEASLRRKAFLTCLHGRVEPPLATASRGLSRLTLPAHGADNYLVEVPFWSEFTSMKRS